MVRRVLIIDDDQQVRSMIAQIMELEGCDVLEAADGEQGFRMFREHAENLDLIIVDIIMPNKEGIETIGDIRRSHPSVKILAISGGGRVKPETYLPIAERIGASGTLAKPFDREELLAAISRL